MRAKIGHLAIAKFDEGWVVCLVTGVTGYNPREYGFLYWDCFGKVYAVQDLTVGRFTRVRPKKLWSGDLRDLTLKDVVEVN